MIELKKWVARRATPLLIVWVAWQFTPLPTARAAVIKDLRTGDNPGFVRLVMEFDRPLTPAPSFSVNQNRLTITLAGIDNLPVTPAAIDGITQLAVFRQSSQTHIETTLAFVPIDIKTFALTGPHRVIIDAYRPVSIPAEPLAAEQQAGGSARPASAAAPEAYGPPAESLPAWSSRLGASIAGDTGPRPAAASGRSVAIQRNRFQQRLIAALIGVTSIIVVLLFFLMRVGPHPGPRKRSWTDRLPSTKDPNVAAIDATIRSHLKKL